MKYSTLIICFAIILSLCCCSAKPNYTYLSNPTPPQKVATYNFSGNQIQVDDVLLILVSALDDVAVGPFNLSTMSKTSSNSESGNRVTPPSEYIVNPEGFINFPILGEIYVKGKTNQELRIDLETRLKQYLTEPLVSISLKNFNISVLGEVSNPGQKSSSTQKLNVFQALALAGDMTAYGDRTRVKLIRPKDGAADQVVNLDVSNSNITTSPYYYLQQNDILYVEADKNKRIASNGNPNKGLILQLLGASIGLISFIISITRK